MARDAKKSRGRAAWKKGHRTESLACWYLRLKGYGILVRRYASPVGEIDIIARRGQSLVFVEVKARATREEALTCITPHQVRRLFQAVKYFRAHHPHLSKCLMRFDFLAFHGWAWPTHIQNAWQEDRSGQ